MVHRRLVRSASNGRLLGAARSYLKQFPEILAIVPGRLAGAALTAGADGAAGVRRYTLPQLAAFLARPAIAERGLAPLGSLGLEALSARVAHEARRDGALKYFDPVAGLPGFAAALARTLSELRLAATASDDLDSRGPAGADLALLLTRYQQELSASSLADLAMIFELAGDPAAGMGLPLLLLDAPLDTRAHRILFSRLAAGAPAVLAAVLKSGPAADGFGEIFGDFEDLDTGAPSNPIEHLRRFVFSENPPASATQEGFEMFSAPGEGLETAEIARRILALAGSKATTFDQMAILLRSPERYQPVMEDALRRAGIPAYFSRGTARPDPAGRAFLALLHCAAEDCSASSFAEYLSLGQVPVEARPAEWVATADEVLTGSGAESAPAEPPGPERVVNAPGGWERLLVDAAVIGGHDRWVRRLRGLEREFELRLESLADEDEAQRNHMSRQLERLRNLAGFALPLIEALDGLPEGARWKDWLDSLAGLARQALRSPDGVLAVLAEFEPMGAVGPVTVEEVAHVLSERLRFLRPDPTERRWGRVFVGSIEEARGCEFRVVFLPGLAEGLFPRRALEDPLLLDDVRKELSRDLPLRVDRNHEERQKLRMAVAAASERFIASYPRMDAAEARARVPSFYALELPRALQGALPKLKEFADETRAAASARLNWPAPREASQAIDDAEYDLVALLPEAGRVKKARYLVESNGHLARSLRSRYSRWRLPWSSVDGLITQNAEALAALASQRLTARAWSASALEQFATCPYKFALNGIHRLRPREDAAPLEELDPLTRGALFHEVQFELLSELKAEGLLPLDGERLAIAIHAADRTLDRIAAKYEDDLAPAVPRVWKTGIEDLRTDLRGWLQQVAQNDGEWQPSYFEYSFGLEPRAGHDAASTREEAVLAEGVRLRGSIDLVEKHTRSGALRVTDHKTGKPPEKIPAYTGGGRVLQPLLYSLAAERLFGANVESGRLFYATQRGGYKQIGINVNASGRRFLERLLYNIDDAVASGFLPPVPEKDACGFCDYRAVCGPYEEHRASRYKNRQDERLDGLHEIRGFL
jgi:CRISPR/Cas system-associated exonuclease Cas4 (RecB family)